MDFDLFSSTEKDTDADLLFSDILSPSHSQMAFALQRPTEKHADVSHLFNIRRIIVGNGIAQFFHRSPPCVTVAPRIWIPRSLEAVTFADMGSCGNSWSIMFFKLFFTFINNI
jgi:hypothetical protein